MHLLQHECLVIATAGTGLTERKSIVYEFMLVLSSSPLPRHIPSDPTAYPLYDFDITSAGTTRNVSFYRSGIYQMPVCTDSM